MNKPANILIIDDNAMNLDIAKDLLESAGYQTLEAEDAVTGIHLMKAHHPDLVLLDLLMPQVDGFEAMQKIKADPDIQKIPIIAFTAMASNANRVKALEYGCVDIISKPIDMQQFLSVVHAYLTNQAPNSHASADPQQPQASRYLISSRPHTVLVVDDNVVNVDLLTEVMESMEQTVIVAYSGEDALRLAEEKQPDLIILDIMMPGMNGYVVLETLKANPVTADIPVIIVSALNRTEDRVKGLMLGGYDYITKPFEFEEVKARVSVTLRIKDLQDQLKKQRDELAIMNKEMAEFTTVASHDLQAPLRKIVMFSDQLQKSSKSPLHEEDRDLLNRMSSSADKMQALIQDLLALSRANYKGRELKPVDLPKVAKEAWVALQGMVQQTQAQLNISELPIIEADETQIRQLFDNLFTNGIKFQRQGVAPVISVYVKVLSDNMVQLIVEDNGIGFNEDYLGRIFQAFERLHGVNQYPGTGIGLAICKKVAERHGGSITAKSILGEGSTFIINLPLYQTG